MPEAPLPMSQTPCQLKHRGLTYEQRKTKQARQRNENSEQARTGVWLARTAPQPTAGRAGAQLTG